MNIAWVGLAVTVRFRARLSRRIWSAGDVSHPGGKQHGGTAYAYADKDLMRIMGFLDCRPTGKRRRQYQHLDSFPRSSPFLHFLSEHPSPDSSILQR